MFLKSHTHTPFTVTTNQKIYDRHIHMKKKSKLNLKTIILSQGKETKQNKTKQNKGTKRNNKNKPPNN